MDPGVFALIFAGPVTNLIYNVGVCYNYGNRQIPTCSMYTNKIIHVCIVFPCVGLCFLVLLRHVFHICHTELFNLFCNTCALCYNTWNIFGAYPVSLVPFPYWVLIYNWRDTNTSTVNWYRGLYVPISMLYGFCTFMWFIKAWYNAFIVVSWKHT